MTSAPVRDAGSLLNYVQSTSSQGAKNLVATGGMNQASGFGDAMYKAQNGNKGPERAEQSRNSNPEIKNTDTGSRKTETVKPREKASATDESGKVNQTGQEEVTAVAEEKGSELTQKIAEKLGVSQEEVEAAMEELGLSVYSLFNPADLTNLVMQLTGETDMTALLTDENLFAGLQDLLKSMQDMKAELMQDFGVSQEELNHLLQTAGADADSVGQPELAQMKAQEASGTPQIVVEVEQNGETVQLAADENGNVEKTLTVDTSEKEQKASGQKGEEQGKGSETGRGSSEGTFSTGNPVLDALLQNKTPAATNLEQTGSLFSQTTQDIMNQIMDYMKIQMKPGMDQMEMQLHPQSLGTVHVQLASKGGEVTAQFQVQNETVKAAIERQIADLKESLKEQGVKVEAVEVTVESHGFESNLWQGNEEQTSSENEKRKTPRKINLNDLDALFEEEATEEEILTAKVMEMNGNTVDYTA